MLPLQKLGIALLGRGRENVWRNRRNCAIRRRCFSREIGHSKRISLQIPCNAGNLLKRYCRPAGQRNGGIYWLEAPLAPLSKVRLERQFAQNCVLFPTVTGAIAGEGD